MADTRIMLSLLYAEFPEPPSMLARSFNLPPSSPLASCFSSLLVGLSPYWSLPPLPLFRGLSHSLASRSSLVVARTHWHTPLVYTLFLPLYKSSKQYLSRALRPFDLRQNPHAYRYVIVPTPSASANRVRFMFFPSGFVINFIYLIISLGSTTFMS